MTQPKSSPLRAFAVLAASALLLQVAVQGARLQDPAHPEQEPEKLQDLNPFRQDEAQESAQDEMVRLFQEVERSMNRMSSLLMDASKGESGKLAEVAGSGMDELLRNGDSSEQPSAGGGSLADLLDATGAEGQSVLAGIERILEIAASQGDGT